MDYGEHVALHRHADWESFESSGEGRTIVLSTKADSSIYDFAFQPNDKLVMGRESAGLPEDIHNSANHRLIIPMSEHMRSLNVAMSAAIVLSEARRQLLFS